jgi:hypothetical protein
MGDDRILNLKTMVYLYYFDISFGHYISSVIINKNVYVFLNC